MTSVLEAPQFTDEAAAYAYVERHLWPTGPICPHCGNCDPRKVGRLNGKTTRIGLRKCYECRKPFTVKMGTIFEDSHAPLRYWLQAIYLMCSSKKGISTRQLQRTLGVGMKTAWFMRHRIRHAMAPAAGAGPLGGPGVTVEADETYLAKSPKTRKPAGQAAHARPAPQVFSLVERGGNIRSMYLDDKNVRGAMAKHLHEASRLVTDGATVYRGEMLKHESVDHSKYEWARGDVHTNTLEGFFSIFKRGRLISESLAGGFCNRDTGALHVTDAELGASVHAEIKLGEIAVKMLLVDVLEHANESLIEKRRLAVTEQLVFEWRRRRR